jgi:hypothetical protein
VVSRLVITALHKNRHANVVLEEEDLEDEGRNGVRLREQIKMQPKAKIMRMLM